MQQPQRRSKLILGLMALGLLAGMALTAHPAQAQVAGPYYAKPSWDRKMGVVNRFVVLTDWNSEAVLDKETGLVWERSPQATLITLQSDALNTCLNKSVGGRLGWRLPYMPELASLIDPSVAAPGPTLPPGHPFVGVQPDVYWSAPAISAIALGSVWLGLVDFSTGNAVSGFEVFGSIAWCVRGGMHAKAY